MKSPVTDLVVLAGGAATRLGPLNTPLPKALMPVAGAPFIAYQRAEAMRSGAVRRLILAIRQGTGPMFTELDFPLVLREEGEPMGTGGAILNAAMLDTVSDPFLVINGDVLFRMDAIPDLIDAAQRTGAAMAVIRVTDAARFGGVRVQNGRVTALPEKGSFGPGLVNAGLYAFTRDAVRAFPFRPCSFETQMAPVMAAHGRLSAITAEGPFIDIGTPESYAQAENFVETHGFSPELSRKAPDFKVRRTR